MANERSRCPMCGTKLKMKNGRMTCKECGYYVRNAAEEGNAGSPGQPYAGQPSPGQPRSASPYPQSSSDTSGRTATQYRTTGSYGSAGHATVSSPGSSPSRRHDEHHPVVAIVVGVMAGVLCLALSALIILFKSGALKDMLPDRDTDRHASASAQDREESSRASEETDAPTKGDLMSSPGAPQSSFFRSVAEYIWDKPCDSITAEELASLTALEIDRDEKSILYQLSGGEAQTATYETDAGLELADLSCFTGLEWISIDDSLYKGDLKGLERLSGLSSENSLEELADIVPHPESITELGVYDSFLASDLSGLDAFPNLMYLSVEYAGLEDISALEQRPDLLGLSLKDCDRLTDFSPLMSLTGLEEVSIASDQLKSIDFIENMPVLNSLRIESTQIASVDALAQCPQLEYLYLYLDGSYNTTDYSVIGDLVLLQELTLEMSGNYNGIMPSFENLTDLQHLELKGVRDISSVRDAVNLTYLSLEDCSGDSLDIFSSLQELQVLYINDFSSYTSSLEPLTHLSKLMMLFLDDTSVFGNIEEIFGIPTLQYLYLDDCQVGMDFDNLPTNETLELLSMNDISILYDPTYNNGGEVSLSEHYDMFSHFPNLTELHLESNGIDSIEFVAGLPKLQYLNITDNHVTSLKPLEGLSDFQAVWCGQNTILESLPESSKIEVYTTEY